MQPGVLVACSFWAVSPAATFCCILPCQPCLDDPAHEAYHAASFMSCSDNDTWKLQLPRSNGSSPLQVSDAFLHDWSRCFKAECAIPVTPSLTACKPDLSLQRQKEAGAQHGCQILPPC